MIQSLAVTRDDRELILEDEGGANARLRIRRSDVRSIELDPDAVKAIHSWTASWLADRYGSEATEDSGDLPKEWRP
jgi:hypothetical protein